MNRIIILVLYLFGPIGCSWSQQDSVSIHSISIGAAYSYQTFLDVGQMLYSDNFGKIRSGYLLGTTYNYNLKGFLVEGGLNLRGDVHRRDSMPLYYGVNGWTRGYTKNLYMHSRGSIRIGFDLSASKSIGIEFLVGLNGSFRFMWISHEYSYNDELYDTGSSIHIYPGTIQVSSKIACKIKVNRNRFARIFFEYNRPFTRLDKAYLAFQEFNIGLSYTLWQSSKTKPPD